VVDITTKDIKDKVLSSLILTYLQIDSDSIYLGGYGGNQGGYDNYRQGGSGNG